MICLAAVAMNEARSDVFLTTTKVCRAPQGLATDHVTHVMQAMRRGAMVTHSLSRARMERLLLAQILSTNAVYQGLSQAKIGDVHMILFHKSNRVLRRRGRTAEVVGKYALRKAGGGNRAR